MWAILLVLAPTGCGTPDIALSVDDVRFERNALLGLSDVQIRHLSLLTAVGLASARGEPERLGQPVLERAREDLLIRQLRAEVALEAAGIDEDDLRAHYTANPEPELLVRHLVILSERWRSDAHRDQARTVAQEALEHARSDVPFPDVAAEFSEEPGAAERGGLLEPGREGTWVGEFWEAAHSLDEGEISPVVETPYGFHVLKLEERRVVPFEEARPRVVARLAAEVDDPELWDAQGIRWAAAMDREDDTDMAPISDAELRAARLAEAERRGLRIPGPDDDRIRADWERRVAQWAGTLGFQAGMSSTELRDQALDALGRTGQGARIAREEILQWADAIEASYPIERPGP